MRTSARLKKRQNPPQATSGARGGEHGQAAAPAARKAAPKRSKRHAQATTTDQATADEATDHPLAVTTTTAAPAAAATAPTRRARRGRGLRRSDTVHVYAGHSETGTAEYENAEDAEPADGVQDEDDKALPRPSVKRKTATEGAIDTSDSDSKRSKKGSSAASSGSAMAVAISATAKSLRQQSNKSKATDSKKTATANVPPPLSDHPFYGNQADAALYEQDPTYSVREPVRAMMHGNLRLLKTLADSPFVSSLHVPANGLTALHHAVRLNNLEAIKFLVDDLIEGKPRPPGRNPSLGRQETGEMSVLTLGYATGKIGAARGGKELNNALLDVNATDHILLWACGRAEVKPDTIQLLLELSSSMGSNGSKGDTHEAVRLSQFEESAGVTAALSTGNIDTARLLMRRIEKHSWNYSEFHFLAMGTHQACAEAVAKKVKHNANMDKAICSRARSMQNLTSVHLAAGSDCCDVLQELVRLAPSALTQEDSHKRLPLHFAAANASSSVLKWILGEGIDGRSADRNKMTALMWAARAGREQNVALIMGADDEQDVVVNVELNMHSYKAEILRILADEHPSLKIGSDGILIVSNLILDLIRQIVCKVTKVTQPASPSDGAAGADLIEAAQSILDPENDMRNDAVAAATTAADEVASAAKMLVRQLSDASEAALGTIFAEIDTDDNKFLSAKEVQACFKKMKIKITPKQLKNDVMAEMDVDADGKVSFHEFRTWMMKGSEFAKMLRTKFARVSMTAEEVEEAERLEATMPAATKPIFDFTAMLQHLLGSTTTTVDKTSSRFVSALVEYIVRELMKASGAAAKEQSKSAIKPANIFFAASQNGFPFPRDSVVMNNVLLPLKDKDGFAAIHHAAANGHTSVVSQLLRYGTAIDLPGPERKTALALAAERGHISTVRLLVSKGAKVNAPDKLKRTPLLLAVRAGNAVEASILLAAGADCDAADSSGNSIVHYATAFGHSECVDLLIKCRANFKIQNAMKLSPIAAALLKDHPILVRKLLEECDLDVNARTADGKTLLLEAAATVSRAGLEQINFLLTDRKADTKLCSSDGLSCLHQLATATISDPLPFIPDAGESDRIATLSAFKSPKELWIAKNGDLAAESDGSLVGSGNTAYETARAKQPMANDSLSDDTPDENSDEEPDEDEEPGEDTPDENSDEEPGEESETPRGSRSLFDKVSEEEKKAIWLLGWDETSWLQGHLPTKPWSALSLAERDAAGIVGYDADSWNQVPVQVVTTSAGSSLQTKAAHVLSVTGSRVKIVANDKIIHVDKLLLLLPNENVQHVWAHKPHIAVVMAKKLVEYGADVNARNQDGETPLMLALQSGKTDLAKYLIDAGADVQARSTSGATALILAAGLDAKGTFANGVTAAATLTGMIIPTLDSTSLNWSMPESGRTALTAALNSTAIDRALQIIKAGASSRCIEAGLNILHICLSKFSDETAHKSLLTALDASDLTVLMNEFSQIPTGDVDGIVCGVTPLHVFVEQICTRVSSNPQVCTLAKLLKQLPSGVNAADCDARRGTSSNSLLHVLVHHRLTCHTQHQATLNDIVQWIVDHGVSGNSVDDQGRTPLLMMVEEDDSIDLSTNPLAQALLPHTNLDQQSREGSVVLTTLFKRLKGLGPMQDPGTELAASIACVLERNADTNVVNPKTGETPLHIAASVRSSDLVKRLIELGVDVDATDLNGQTPLMQAIISAPVDTSANFEVEELLLQAGADCTKTDSRGRTVTHFAFLKSTDALPEAFALLEEADGKTAFTTAGWKYLGSGNAIDPVETISSLTASRFKAPVDVADKDGLTPLHLACWRGASVCATKLIQMGASTEKTFSGNTALGIALHAYPELGILLLQRDIVVNATATLLGAPGKSLKVLGAPESLFSLAVRQMVHLSHDQRTASAYLGTAYTMLDKGYGYASALGDALRAGELSMWVALLPKADDDMICGVTFAGGQNLLHALASVKAPKSVATTAGFQLGDIVEHRYGNFKQGRIIKINQQHFDIYDENSKTHNSLSHFYLHLVHRKVADEGLVDRLGSILISRGVCSSTQDAKGRTPLMLAALNGHVDLCKAFLQSSNALAAACDDMGQTALSYCLKNTLSSSTLAVVESLMATGASVNARYALSIGYQTVLMRCFDLCANPRSPEAKKQKSALYLMLSSGAPVDPFETDSSGRTLLHAAAAAAKFAKLYVQLALDAAGTERQKSLLMTRDCKGKTCLVHAVESGNAGCVSQIIAAANVAGCVDELLLTQDSTGDTVFSAAIRSSLDQILLPLLLGRPSMMNKLLRVANVDGYTVLMQAVMVNNLEAVNMLLAGRPQRPAPIKTACPSFCFAGQTATVFICLNRLTQSYEIHWQKPKDMDTTAPPEDATAPPGSALSNGSASTRVLYHNWDNDCDRFAQNLLFSKTVRCPEGIGPGDRCAVAVELFAAEGSVSEFAEPLDFGACLGESDSTVSELDQIINIAGPGGKTALHLCISPRPFGSYENDKMLTKLVSCGAVVNAAIVQLAQLQTSGRLLACLVSLGKAASTATVTLDDGEDGEMMRDLLDPLPDCEAAIAAATQSAMAEDPTEEDGSLLINPRYTPPATTSKCIVTKGDDGTFFDLVMTKVDVTSGPYGKNVYYKMQVIHERNQDLFTLFTHWGRIGDEYGQHQTTPFPTKLEAEAEFKKIFKSKSGNDWEKRSDFEKRPGKYQLRVRSTAKTAEEVLDIGSWLRLPSSKPTALQRLLNVAHEPSLISGVIASSQLDSSTFPLGKLALATSEIDEAVDSLKQIRSLLSQSANERQKDIPDAKILQRLADEVAALSSRYYELIPHKNYSHTNVGPLQHEREIAKELVLVEQLGEIQGSCKILLGAQNQLKALSPIDYICRAAGCSFQELDYASDEMAVLQEYINAGSAVRYCCLFHGGANYSDAASDYRQCTEQVPLYATSDPLPKSKAGTILAPGTVVKLLWTLADQSGDARKVKVPSTGETGWILSLRQTQMLSVSASASTVAAVHRVERHAEAERAGSMKHIGNRQLLFHGSGMANAISMLSGGLKVKPAGVYHSGSAFGDGIYFANSFEKSIGYVSYHGDTGFMLLCEVAAGKELTDIRQADGVGSSAFLSKTVARAAAADGPGPTVALSDDLHDLRGTGYDSVHVCAPTGPMPGRSLYHPDGYSIPVGKPGARGQLVIAAHTCTNGHKLVKGSRHMEAAAATAATTPFSCECKSCAREILNAYEARHMWGCTACGYDVCNSCHSAHQSPRVSVSHDEIVVYNPEQVRLRYVIELRKINR